MRSLSGNVDHSQIVLNKRSKINPLISFEQFKHGLNMFNSLRKRKPFSKEKKKALIRMKKDYSYFLE